MVPSDLLHPRHWPVWLGVGLLRLVVMLPLGAQLAAGKWAGRILYRFAGRARFIAERNLELCFPDKSAGERDELVRKHFEALGIGVVETGLCWWASDEKIAPLAEFTGDEFVERAKAEGRGVIMLATHVACQELGARLFSLRHGVDTVVYKPLKDPVLDYVSTRCRGRLTSVVSRKALRPVVKSVKNGGTTWVTMDHAEGTRRGVIVPFFGEPKTMATGAVRIAEMTGAAALAFLIFRKEGGLSYECEIRPPLGDWPSNDATADARRLIEVVEDQVELAPEQYSWAHPRFRKRSGPYEDPYRV